MEYRINRTMISNQLYSENNQYFCSDIIKFSDAEVFVDGGAYTGDTIQQFVNLIKKSKYTFKKIIAFEPDENSYKLLTKFFGKRKDVILIPKGLFSSEKELYFCETGVSSRVILNEDKSTTKVSVINIDSVPECQDATFIKMDIEGAEMEALYGAKKIIIQNHPKLAICIYHSNEDMIRIIEYIHSLVPEYRIFVRHHSRGDLETVMYAVI